MSERCSTCARTKPDTCELFPHCDPVWQRGTGTPRTDAAAVYSSDITVADMDVVSADFARQLERELAELPNAIRRASWKTPELRESAAKLVESYLATEEGE